MYIVELCGNFNQWVGLTHCDAIFRPRKLFGFRKAHYQYSTCLRKITNYFLNMQITFQEFGSTTHQQIFYNVYDIDQENASDKEKLEFFESHFTIAEKSL